MARAKGLSKSKGYINRVFCVEYDAKGMIDAYGIEFMHWLLDEIHAGRMNCKQYVERWSAHVHLNNTKEFAPVRHRYGENTSEIDIDKLVA